MARHLTDRFSPNPRQVSPGYFPDQGDGTLLYVHSRYRSLAAVSTPPPEVQGIWDAQILAERGHDIVELATQNARFGGGRLTPGNFNTVLGLIMGPVQLEFMSGRSRRKGTELLFGYQSVR
jgi:hypothetical protein